MKTIIIIFFILITQIFSMRFYAQYNDCTSMSHVWGIKKNQTGGGNTEVHVMNKNTSYSSYIVNVVTPVEEVYDGKFQFTAGDYQSGFYSQQHPALWAIKKWGTGTGKTEVHILDPRTNFTTYINQTGTVLAETNNDYIFLAGKYLNYYYSSNICDLWVLKKFHTNSGNFELQILSGESNFQSVIYSTVLPIYIDCKDSWQFALGDYNYDNITDLYMFKIYRNERVVCDDVEIDNANTPPNVQDALTNIEIHVRDGNNFATSLTDVITPLAATHPSQIQMLVGRMLHGSCIGQYTMQPDVYAVLKNGTSSGKTEIHVLNRLSNYTSFFFQTTSIMDQSYDNMDFVTASFWYGTVDKESKEVIESKQTDLFKSKISCYPNPFNPKTKIKYSVRSSSYVSIKIFDVIGREIATLMDEYSKKGDYEIDFDGTNLPSGVYFYRALIGNDIFTDKIIINK
ncbi:MAG: T9SS type A sorting domain-containing protein [Ignavibacteria bacterium]|nr:T9SS type A sorting domain-containing protein [Ignavibacteria bacterium]